MSAQDKIIEKIRKMMAIAKDNADGGEHERDNALRMAYKLMAKHNLNEKDIGSSSGVSGGLDQERVASNFFIEPCPWRRWICGAIGELFFCTVFTERVKEQSYKVVFVGAEGNSITAMEMSRFLIKDIEKEGRRLRKARYGNAKGEASRFETTFFNATSSTISRRCKALREEAEQESAIEVTVAEAAGSTGALVLANFYQQEMEKNALFLKESLGIAKLNPPKKGGKVAYDDPDAVRLGRQYGDKINLSKQIN